MNKFQLASAYITKKVCEPSQLAVTSIQEEPQNAKYGARSFKLLG